MPTLSFVHPVTQEPVRRAGDGYRGSGPDVFTDSNGMPCFVQDALRAHMANERTGLINQIKTFLRRFPTLYRFLVFVISPACFTGVSPAAFLRRYGVGSLILNIGSGVHRYRRDVINLDIFPYEGVDVVADATALPFPEDTADAMLCVAMLEHVPNPQKVVDEMLRVLKPGGQAYVFVPFVYPFHASPNDFYRWSHEGLRHLLRNGTVVEIGTRCGPTSALTAQLVTWASIVLSCGSEFLYNVAYIVLQVLFFPLKFLDLLFGRFPTAVHGAACFYAIVEKPR